MKKALIIALAIFLLTGVASNSYAETDFILEIDPLSLLVSPNIDGFEINRGGTTELLEGGSSWVPSVKAGVGFDLSRVYLDFMGGIGFLWNDAFTSTNYMGDLAVLFKVDERGIFALGPHAGFIYFDPKWDGTSEIKIDNTTGWLGGIKFLVGGKKVKFAASIDYLGAEFDVTGENGWIPSEDKLDISGLAIQLGVMFRF